MRGQADLSILGIRSLRYSAYANEIRLLNDGLQVFLNHQRNIYKGEPARARLRLQLNRRDGHSAECEFLVDTGNPCALIVSEAMLGEMLWRESFGVDSNFGPLDAGWLSVTVSEVGDEFKILGFANDAVV